MKSTFSSALTSFIFVTCSCMIPFFAYYSFCNGWDWAIDLSPTYFLAIVRIIVVIVLSIISAVIVPFKYFSEFMTHLQYAAIIGLVVAVGIALMASSSNGSESEVS